MALIDMARVAEELDVHYDTVRKGWKGWVRRRGFPAPVEVDPYKWNPVSIESYKARREAENRAAVLEAAPGDRPEAAPPSPSRRVDAQRSAVSALMMLNSAGRPPAFKPA